MSIGNNRLLRKLQSAINSHSVEKILISQNEWYSDKMQRTITSYVIKKALVPKDVTKGRKKTIELFTTTSQIQAVLYLRDYWNLLRGEEVPTDNEYWNMIKQKKGIVIDVEVDETEISDE